MSKNVKSYVKALFFVALGIAIGGIVRSASSSLILTLVVAGVVFFIGLIIEGFSDDD